MIPLKNKLKKLQSNKDRKMSCQKLTDIDHRHCVLFLVLSFDNLSKMEGSKVQSEKGASEVQHDHRKPPLSKGFYTN